MRFLPILAFLVVPVVAHASEDLGDEVARIAAHYRDARPALRVKACNGLIEDVLRDAGIDDLRGNVRSLYAEMRDRGWTHRRKIPDPGDIVFFDKTYDSNRNGKQDDPLSHIAIVIDVDADGTVHMVHHGSKGIRPLTMNLRDPGARRDDSGKVINSWLGQPGYAQEGHKLAGELWHGFATPDGEVRRRDPRESAIARSSMINRGEASASIAGRQLKIADERRPSRARVPGATIDGPLLTLDDPGFARVWDGARLRARHLDGRSCRELWFLRNAVFARHGYAFTSPDGLAAFTPVPGYVRDPAVNKSTVADMLKRRDRDNIAEIQWRERRCTR